MKNRSGRAASNAWLEWDRTYIYIYTSLNIKNMSLNGISASDGSFLPRYSTFPCIFYVLLPFLKFHAWWEWHRSRATTVKRCRSQRDEGRNRNLDPPEILRFCRSSLLHLSFNKLLPPSHLPYLLTSPHYFRKLPWLRRVWNYARSIVLDLWGKKKKKARKQKKRVNFNEIIINMNCISSSFFGNLKKKKVSIQNVRERNPRERRTSF